MQYTASRTFALAVAVCLGWGSLARADYIAQFNFTPDKTDIFATNDPTLGKITLSNESPSKAEGNTTLIATNITTSAAPTTHFLGNPAVFKDAAFTLTLFITDFKSGKSDQMYFSGKFDGKLSQGAAQIFETPTTPTTVAKQIGDRIYTVTVGPYVPPGNPTSGTVGSLGAVATIKVSAVPEPSSMVLAAFGAMTVGGWWFRRRRAAVNLA
jgi:hypothetical protein